MPLAATPPPGAAPPKKNNTAMIAGIVVVLLLVIASVVVGVLGYKKGWFTGWFTGGGTSTTAAETAATPITGASPIAPVDSSTTTAAAATTTTATATDTATDTALTAADDAALDAGTTEESTEKETKVKDGKGDTYVAIIAIESGGTEEPPTTDQKTRVDSKPPNKDSGYDVYFVANKSAGDLTGLKLSLGSKDAVVSFGAEKSWGTAQQWTFQHPAEGVGRDQWKEGSYLKPVNGGGKYLGTSGSTLILEDYTGQATQRWVWESKKNTLRNVINGRIYKDGAYGARCEGTYDKNMNRVVSISMVKLDKVNEEKGQKIDATAAGSKKKVLGGYNILKGNQALNDTGAWVAQADMYKTGNKCTWPAYESTNGNGWFFESPGDKTKVLTAGVGKVTAETFTGDPNQVWNFDLQNKRLTSNSNVVLGNLDLVLMAEVGYRVLDAFFSGNNAKRLCSDQGGEGTNWQVPAAATGNWCKWICLSVLGQNAVVYRSVHRPGMYLTANGAGVSALAVKELKTDSLQDQMWKGIPKEGGDLASVSGKKVSTRSIGVPPVHRPTTGGNALKFITRYS